MGKWDRNTGQSDPSRKVLVVSIVVASIACVAILGLIAFEKVSNAWRTTKPPQRNQMRILLNLDGVPNETPPICRRSL